VISERSVRKPLMGSQYLMPSLPLIKPLDNSGSLLSLTLRPY
jgi:hypothetical protein